MISYNAEDIAQTIGQKHAPAVVVFPNQTPRDALRRLLEESGNFKAALSMLIVIPCDTQSEAADLSYELEADMIHHLLIKEET